MAQSLDQFTSWVLVPGIPLWTLVSSRAGYPNLAVPNISTVESESPAILSIFKTVLTRASVNKMGIPVNPFPQPDEHCTQPSSHKVVFPIRIADVEPGSAASADTKITLRDGFYDLMSPYLAYYGADGQTVTASRLTAATNKSRDNSYVTMSDDFDDFFRYLRSKCKEDLGRWDQKDSEKLSDMELHDYVHCGLSSKLRLRGTMLVGNHLRPVVFTSFRQMVWPSEQEAVKLEEKPPEEEPQRCHTLYFQAQELLQWERLGIDLWRE